MELLADEARQLSAGHVLGVRGRNHERAEEDDSDAAVEDLVANISCTTLGGGCWLPVPTDWDLPSQVPLSYVAMLGVGGSAEYRIGEATYRLQPGGLLLCPPHVRRAGRHDTAERLQLYSVRFHARLYGVLDIPAVCHLPVAFHPAPPHHARMVGAVQRIIIELGRRELGHILAADAACAELLALIWREAYVRGDSRPVETARLARLAPVFRLIEERYAERLTLRQLAGAVHLGPAYFSAFFTSVVGVSPMRYLARYRLDRVREFLLTTDLPLAAVARHTGFVDAAYLSRVFHAAEGMPPGQYRRTQSSPMVP